MSSAGALHGVNIGLSLAGILSLIYHPWAVELRAAWAIVLLMFLGGELIRLDRLLRKEGRGLDKAS